LHYINTIIETLNTLKKITDFLFTTAAEARYKNDWLADCITAFDWDFFIDT
jgi:hypothetical protein